MIVRELVTLLGFKTDTGPLNKYGNVLQNVLSATTILATATVALGSAFLKGAGDIEQVTIAFETMLGSTEAASDLLKDITDFAAKTPFELTGLIESSKQLLTFKFGADEVIDVMRMLGDTAAGVGKDKLPTIIRAFGRIRLKGKSSLEEINMLTEAGVPILGELANMLGISEDNMGELFDRISKGQITFDHINQAFINMTTGSGQFANLMEKQSKSFLGIITNIMDTITNLSNAIGQELLPMAKSMARWILELLQGNEDIIKVNLVAYFKAFGRVIATIAVVIRKLANIFKGFIKRIFQAFGGTDLLKDAFERTKKALDPIIKSIITFIKLLGDLFNWVFKVVEEFKIGDTILNIWEGALKAIGTAIDIVVKAFKFLMPFIQDIIKVTVFLAKIWGEIWTFIFNFIDALVKDIIQVITDLVTFLEGVVNSIRDFFLQIGQGIQQFVQETGFEAVTRRLKPETLPNGGGTNNFNVDTTVTLEVPPGTPEYQKQQLQSLTKQSIQETWNEMLRNVIPNVPDTDFQEAR